MQQRYVGEILVKSELLEREKLEELLEAARDKGLGLLDVLIATRAIEEDELVKALAAEVGMDFLERIDPEGVPVELVEQVPITFARQHRVLAVGHVDDAVQVAVANPLDPTPLDDIRALLGMPVEGIAATAEAIDDAINRVYERTDETALADSEGGDEDDELQDLIDMTDEAPVIRWVNNLFYTSVRERASDIHIEPTDKEVAVRYRIDGKLVPRKTANRGFLASIVSRVKIEAGLNIAERRLPQDGRITKKIAGKVVDVRVSTIPTAKGERVVMRLLDKQNIMLDLTDLGFARAQLETWDKLVRRPNGIVLVTGPTGSGKTTTLYGSLNTINTPEKNILTVEDPVEYELPGIGQMQVQPKIGLTFANGLRSFLRQDPDVIMVGEIRDHETADIAIHASLTGHLVLSTLHTNDAPSAITRLVDMDIQPFQISTTVMAVLAQRLVRRLCPHCRTPYRPSDEDLQELGIDLSRAAEELAELERVAKTTVLGSSPPPPSDELLEDETTQVLHVSELEAPPPPLVADDSAPEPTGGARVSSDRPVFYHPNGCDECSQTGYRGRVGIYELMVINEAVRREILNKSDSKTIQRAAQESGMRLLREDGARQVIAGITSVEEVLAATQAEGLE